MSARTALSGALSEAQDTWKHSLDPNAWEPWIVAAIPFIVVSIFTIIAFICAFTSYLGLKKAKAKTKTDDPSCQRFWKLYKNSQILNIVLLLFLVYSACIAMVLTVKFTAWTNRMDIKGLMYSIYGGVTLAWIIQCYNTIGNPRLLRYLVEAKVKELRS
ncbi:hypothetical protein FSARC_4536 [Fusarium sarcochroum]|uniref:Uncharacterized protein n=1 Tax=Fusarium sarcochroum TaxID=1208366 RepID=A0A8H4U1M5_9HYPO|nr:hypothetical protein FSARC_4536 [Fusarium sarcochroum]